MSVIEARLAAQDDPAEFWRLAMGFLARRIPPERITFGVGTTAPDLFGAPAFEPDPSACPPAHNCGIAPAARALLDTVLLHRDPARFSLCYRLAWRLSAQRALLEVACDADVVKARQMEKAVRRDKHKMTAFVRFREVPQPEGPPIYVAWFEPEHHIVAASAPFFRDRFAGMNWSILTPDRCAHWDGRTLTLAPGARRSAAPSGDPTEDLWRTYYAHIFNPARLMPKAMKSQMPKKYWKNLPEARLIAPLIETAAMRARSMIDAQPTTPDRRIRKYEPAPIVHHDDLTRDITRCKRCSLHCHATQGVPGEGPPQAPLMIVGEQPGHEEDLSGRPFVGPAGRLLDKALAAAGIDRQTCYVTNAVKHFKFEPRGKVRLHKSPNVSEIEHCRWWLEQEIALQAPRVILTLGVTAARALLRRPVTMMEIRSQPHDLNGAMLIATVHPSYLLRLTDADDKRRQWRMFLDDLALVHQAVGPSKSAA